MNVPILIVGAGPTGRCSSIAGSELLDSYEPERRPSGERNLLRSRGQLQAVSALAADLGVVYSSGGIVTERPAVIEPTMPACVGSRAPHVWLDADGERLSTLDLFDHQMVLLTGVKGKAWRDAARAVASTLEIPLGIVAIGGAEFGDPSNRWLSAYGVDADGAVLVRPDGHIAWRSFGAAADAMATLQQVMARVLALSVAAEADRRCA